MHKRSRNMVLQKQIFQAYNSRCVNGRYVDVPVYEENIHYDRRGRILTHRELHWRLNPRKRPIAAEYVHKYEGEKEIEVQYYFPVGELMHNEQNEFDAGGRLACSRILSPEGKCVYENYFSYDNKGNLVEMIDFSSELNLNSIYKYQYDAKGNRLLIQVYDAQRDLQAETQYEYDKYGNRRREIVARGGGVSREVIVYEYDRDGDAVWRKWYSTRLEDITEYSYVRAEKSLKTICRQYRFDCDCTGVRRVPKSTEVTKRLYF